MTVGSFLNSLCTRPIRSEFMLSYWERTQLLRSEVIIVGGGIVGLSVAASIAEKFPAKSVTVFERSVLPYGASTRNAGFACFGSLSEVASDIQHMGEEAARKLLFQRWMGLQITRKRLGDEAIGFSEAGGYELLPTSERAKWGVEVKRINALVADFLPDYLMRKDAYAASLGIKASGDVYSMRGEGQVDTGMLMRTLERYVTSLGVGIRSGACVIATDSDGIVVDDPVRGEMRWSADQVIVCTNAFAETMQTGHMVEPGRGQVFITHPINGLRFQGNLHLEEGYYYLRNVDDRLLFGGGRNLDFDGERTKSFALTDQIQQALEQKLRALFGEDFTYEVDQRWSGIMAFGKDKQPVVERLQDGRILAIKLSGMGIALAGYVGEEVAEMLD